MKQKEEQHPLKGVKWGIMGVCVYRGNIVERLIGGYRLRDKVAKSEQEVDEIINSVCKRTETTIIS